MKKHLFGVALLMCLTMAGVANAQIIDAADIQNYDALGAPDSPYVGQTVTARGSIYVVPGTYNGGTQYLLDATGGISFYLSGTGLTYGDVVEVTGTVGDFGGEIQLASPSVSLISTGNPEPVPVETPLSTIMADYEQVGNFVTAIGTVSAVNSSNFYVYDGTDTIQVYIDSTTLIDISAVDVGDVYAITSPVVVYQGEIELKPRRQSDLVENPGGDTLPVIDNVSMANWVRLADESHTVTCTITDDSAVASALLYYRDNNLDGTAPSAWMSTAMTNVGGDDYEGVIPAPHASDQVEFYVEATDDGAQTVTNPGSAPAAWYTAAVGITPIYATQYVHPDSSSQSGAYNGKYVNVEGIITAGTGQAGAASKFIMQEADPSPDWGTYAFGGTLVYESSAAYEWYRGDLVQVGGIGNEYFGLTQVLPHNGDAINLVDFGQDLPPASKVPTRILADDETNGGEAWESVWIKTFTSAVFDTLGYGDYIVCDKDSRADSCVVAPLVALAYQPIIGDVLTVEGFMDYNFGAFKIVPISDEFIVISAASGVNVPTIEPAGGFRSIAPNPFNPQANIKFVVNRDELVQLNVYNIRGEKVRTLVQGRLPANEYTFVFDGKSDSGASLASGMYFARLRIGKEVMQVRKMSLVK